MRHTPKERRKINSSEEEIESDRSYLTQAINCYLIDDCWDIESLGDQDGYYYRIINNNAQIWQKYQELSDGNYGKSSM